MKIIRTQDGFDCSNNEVQVMSLSSMIKRKKVNIYIVGIVLAACVDEIYHFISAKFEEKFDVEIDLSKVSYLCPDAVQMLLKLNMEADNMHRHSRIAKISVAAYDCIHSVRFVSQLLSGTLTKVETPSAFELPEPSTLEPEIEDLQVECSDETNTSRTLTGEDIAFSEETVASTDKPPKNEVSESLPIAAEYDQHIPLSNLENSLLVKSALMQTRKLDLVSKPNIAVTKALHPPTVPYLLRLSSGKLYQGQNFKTTIGRAEYCDIALYDAEYISRMHAHIVVNQDGNFIVTDSTTTNTTMLNGVELSPKVPVSFPNHAWLQLADEHFYVALGDKAKMLVDNNSKQFAYMVCCKTQEHFSIAHETVLLGRENLWPNGSMDSEYIGRKHAFISWQAAKPYLVDNHSANNTYLNGVLLQPEIPYSLENGDHIILGITEFIFKTIQIQKEVDE